MKLHVGTSGYSYKEWKGNFYPEDLPAKEMLSYYSRRLPAVEINNTFYHLPKEETFAAWGKKAPPDFLYAIKASRYLTHIKRLKDPEEGLARFFAGVKRLKDHAGPILFQLPPHWHWDQERLRYFIRQLPSRWRHVFEFRHPSWCNEEVRSLLTKKKVSFCIHDLRDFSCPKWVTGPLVYVRFHGATAIKYAGCYDSSHLQEWAEHIREYQQSGLDVFAYFNNDNQGYAVKNAQELRTLLKLASPPGAEKPAEQWW